MHQPFGRGQNMAPSLMKDFYPINSEPSETPTELASSSPAAAAALDAAPEHHGDEHPLQPFGAVRLRAPDAVGSPQRDRRHPSQPRGEQQQHASGWETMTAQRLNQW